MNMFSARGMYFFGASVQSRIVFLRSQCCDVTWCNHHVLQQPVQITHAPTNPKPELPETLIIEPSTYKPNLQTMLYIYKLAVSFGLLQSSVGRSESFVLFSGALSYLIKADEALGLHACNTLIPKPPCASRPIVTAGYFEEQKKKP